MPRTEGANSIPCPFCGATKCFVLDSRLEKNYRRRRKQCENCGKRFTTYETLIDVESLTIRAATVNQVLDRIKSFCEQLRIPVDTQ